MYGSAVSRDADHLIHTNGRLFDPTLGIFLQADPLIQDALNLQSYNRYGYCYNNPLGCTDPSGLSFLSRLFHATHKLVRSLRTPRTIDGSHSASTTALL